MAMPLIAEPKQGRPGKFPRIYDCRVLKGLLEKLPFKIERLREFVKRFCTNGSLWSIYRLSAYSHAEVNERFRTLIGFNFGGVDYVYNCVPFGLLTSAYAPAKLTAVATEVLRRSELATALMMYLDDFGGSIGPVPEHPRMAQIVATTETEALHRPRHQDQAPGLNA